MVLLIPGQLLADEGDGGDDDHARSRYLIADQFNNRVIEVDRDGKIVWQFGRGPADF
jgi:hypothetical protein